VCGAETFVQARSLNPGACAPAGSALMNFQSGLKFNVSRSPAPTGRIMAQVTATKAMHGRRGRAKIQEFIEVARVYEIECIKARKRIPDEPASVKIYRG
jgi:hypothetical protein